MRHQLLLLRQPSLFGANLPLALDPLALDSVDQLAFAVERALQLFPTSDVRVMAIVALAGLPQDAQVALALLPFGQFTPGRTQSIFDFFAR